MSGAWLFLFICAVSLAVGVQGLVFAAFSGTPSEVLFWLLWLLSWGWHGLSTSRSWARRLALRHYLKYRASTRNSELKALDDGGES